MKQRGIKYIVILMILLLTSGTLAFAQQGHMEKIRLLKKEYINRQVQLTPSQSKAFWPVYNKYESDLKQLRQSYMKQYNARKHRLSPEEARRYIDDNLDYQDALVDLKRMYKKEFLKVLSPVQLARLYVAEREFRQMLIQKLREQKRG